MAKKVRVKRLVIPVPKSLDEAAKFLAQIGEEQRVLNTIQSDFNAEVDGLKPKTKSPHDKRGGF